MQATRMVYLLIGFFIFLPWTAFTLKRIIPRYRRTRKPPWGWFIAFLAGTVLIAAGVYGHFQFTIGYQAPLAAERAGVLFNQRVAGDLDLPSYMDAMAAQGLADENLVTVSRDEMEQVGFQQKHYNLAISQRTFDAGTNQVNIYMMHSNEQDASYSYVTMVLVGNTWRVLEHQVITQEQIEEVEARMRFTEIRP